MIRRRSVHFVADVEIVFQAGDIGRDVLQVLRVVLRDHAAHDGVVATV